MASIQVVPPTDEEKAKFVQCALEELEDPEKLQEFENKIKQVAFRANQLDAALDKVTRCFQEVIDKRGTEFPGLAPYLKEWKLYKARWVQYLANSRDVASEHITILQRFDKVFLDMVETIKKDEDRESVIAEFKAFSSENHGGCIKLSQDFLALKDDIQLFFIRFDRWFADAGTKLANEATNLKREIDDLHAQIEVLDKKIKDATTALAISGGLLNIAGVIIAGPALAELQAQRRKKIYELEDKIKALENINRKQPEPAHLKTEFDVLKPEIALTFEQLIVFAEIWPTVRSLAIHIQNHLEGGMAVVGKLRFRIEVRLTREVCQLLARALGKYASDLENRGQTKSVG